MKMPSDFDDFLRNEENKRTLLRGGEREVRTTENVFSNVENCCFIDTSQTHLIPELASDHQEADTKLVALVHAAQISPC